jgi:hypothetical protein
MEAVAGIFDDAHMACEALDDLRARGLEQGRATLLFPAAGREPLEKRVEVDDTESPGMGGAVGAVVGGAIGLATASIVLPGVGTVLIAGELAGGVAAAAGGGVLGRQAERGLSLGVTHDELGVYRAALLDGKTVLIAGGDTADEADAVRAVLRAAGAESIDAAREGWLRGF